MGRALDVELRVIPARIANPFVDRVHYSGKHVNNSQLHLGAFLDGRLHGVMSFGPPMDKSKVIGLVKGTPWNGMIELNRMAFDDTLPRNSESRCIGLAMRMLKKNAPHVKWVLSFADGCSCGDGTIYRASNFVLTGITKNSTILRLPNGEEISNMTITAHPDTPRPELGGKTAREACGGGLSLSKPIAAHQARGWRTASCFGTSTSSTSDGEGCSPCRKSHTRASKRSALGCTRA